jgi:hypothetical protein
MHSGLLEIAGMVAAMTENDPDVASERVYPALRIYRDLSTLAALAREPAPWGG